MSPRLSAGKWLPRICSSELRSMHFIVGAALAAKLWIFATKVAPTMRPGESMECDHIAYDYSFSPTDKLSHGACP